MTKIIIIIFFIITYTFNSIAMEKKPYHHLPDGTFRNPEGSPQRDSNFNWSFKVFNKEKKKININVPEGHIINKKMNKNGSFNKN